MIYGEKRMEHYPVNQVVLLSVYSNQLDPVSPTHIKTDPVATSSNPPPVMKGCLTGLYSKKVRSAFIETFDQESLSKS